MQKWRKKTISFILGTTFSFFIFWLGSSIYFARSYEDRFYPKATVNGIQISGLTPEQATLLIDKKLGTELPEQIVLQDEETFLASDSAAIDLSFNTESVVKDLFEKSHPDSFFSQVIAAWKELGRETEAESTLVFSEEKAREMVTEFAEEINVPGAFPRATLAYSASPRSLGISNGEMGEVVDVDKTLERMQAGIANKSFHITVAIKPDGLVLSEQGLENARERALNFVEKQITAKSDDQRFFLDDTQLVELLEFPQGFNEEKVDELITDWKSAVDREPQDAVFDFDKETLEVYDFQPHKNGLSLQLQETKVKLLNLLAKIESDSGDEFNHNLTLMTDDQQAMTNLSSTNDLGINERIGFGDSLYAHSIPSRIHNVALTAEKINNTIIKPGEEFSFNRTLGEVSRRTGFQPAYVIKGGQTVLGDGGGVCQVSTTTFRAALDAGVDISKRLPHSYRVSYYELNSKPGIDATVYSGDIDFRFINDTPEHILLHTETDSENLYMKVELYGTSDGRSTKIIDHKTYGYTPPLPTQYINTDTLPTGVTRQIDWAVSGIKAEFTHQIFDKNGNKIHEKTYYSSYRPWAAKYLLGI